MREQHYTILGPNTGSQLLNLESYYIPVRQEGDHYVISGEPRRDTTADYSDMVGYLVEYENVGPAPGLAAITPPAGWQLVANFLLPEGYVPASREVRDEARNQAIQRLKDMGVWRDD